VNELRKIILITGTPGVGKTLISSHLAKEMNAIHIDLAEIVKQERLVSGIDEERKTLIANKQKLSNRVQKVIEQQKDKNIIVDGHFATDILPSKDVTKVFVLRRHPQELKQMMEKRGFKNSKLWENLAAEILDVCLYDAVKACGIKKVCEIDVTWKNVKDVVDEIVSILNGKKACMIKIVDWLGQLEQEKRLDEFLKEF
jgi:adenylate kinase